MDKTNIVLRVKTETAALLWKEELQGQISDGMWENSRQTDWQTWCHATAEVSTEVGVSVPVGTVLKRGRSFRFVDLIDCVGDRMLELGRTVDPAYDTKRLRRDLNDLMRAVRYAYNP